MRLPFLGFTISIRTDRLPFIRLDLFEYGLERFSDEEFDEYGINAEQRSLIKFMAQQEVRLGGDTMSMYAPCR